MAKTTKYYTLKQIQEYLNDNHKSIMDLDENIKIAVMDNHYLYKSHILSGWINLFISKYYASWVNHIVTKRIYYDYRPKQQILTDENLRWDFFLAPPKPPYNWSEILGYSFTVSTIFILLYSIYTAYNISTIDRIKKNEQLIELYKQKDILMKNRFELDHEKHLIVKNLSNELKELLIRKEFLEEARFMLEIVDKYIN